MAWYVKENIALRSKNKNSIALHELKLIYLAQCCSVKKEWGKQMKEKLLDNITKGKH